MEKLAVKFNPRLNLNHLSETEKKEAVLKFLLKIEKTSSGCWEWNKALNFPNGYGVFYVDKKNILAHRASWMLFRGEIGNLFVCHKCDNKRCVNPEHLFLGTIFDNKLDEVSKGLHVKGERQGLSKLNNKKVLEIRADKKTTGQDLAKKYGVSGNTISQVKLRNIWRHV